MPGRIVPEHVSSKIQEVVSWRDHQGGLEDSFFVIDPKSLEDQYKLWKKHLPIVTPHYAVKCNNHPEVLSTLKRLGTCFDCASLTEINEVIGNHGADPESIVYANPIKAPSHLKRASELGVKRMTFDNIAELHKVQKYGPQSELLLRIKTDDSGAICSLSCKFGAAMSQAEQLLAEARKLNLNVVGVAYHVGSGGGTGPEAHAIALKDAREVFELASTKFGYDFTVLDVGGGFEACPEDFIPVAKQINESLQTLGFISSSAPSNLEIIGEPGRFFVSNGFALVANVIGVREAPNQEETDMAYLTDGVYGNLNSIIYDHQHPKGYLVGDWESNSVRSERATLWGPTCDGLDSISTTPQFPRRLKVGDWIYFPDSGAYTLVGESEFNGFNTNTHVYVADGGASSGEPVPVTKKC